MSGAPTRPPRGVRLTLFLSLLLAYLLSTSRERPWADATPVWQAAESLVTNGSFAVTTPWPPDSPPGRGGKHYAYQPLLTSLVHVPAAAVREAIGKVAPTSRPMTLPFAAHVGPSAMAALAGLLFFDLLLALGVTLTTTSVVTLLTSFATGLWVYAHSTYTETTQAAAYIGFIAAAVRAQRNDTPPIRAGVWLGAWAAALVNTKLLFVLALPLPLAALAYAERRRPERLLRLFVGAAGPLLVGAAVALAYNRLRFGSWLDTGYNAGLGDTMARGRVATGLWGLLVSPGKSVLLYNPLLVVAALGWPLLWRRNQAAVWVIAGATIPVVLFYARFAFWHGDVAWGPRYLTFVLPVAMVPLGLWLDERRPRRLRLAAFSAVAAAALAIQALGVSLYWDHWSRIAVDARIQWLGMPNRTGATSAPGAGCGVCFEDVFEMHYLPQFQPIRGYWWLVRHVAAGHDWVRAERDAPWHPDTTLTLNLAATYPRARFDWWLLDHKRFDWTWVCALGLTVGLALSSWRWWHALRAPRPAP